MPREHWGPVRPGDFAELPAARQGSQSVVSVQDRKGAARVLKRAAVGRKLTLPEAQLAVANVRIYRNDLELNGWNLPAESETRIVGRGEAVEVWIIERYIPGGDLASLSYDDRRVYQALMQVAATVAFAECRSSLATLDGAPKLSIMSYGLDLKPSNIVVHSGTGTTYLVDTFPPLNFDGRGEFAYYTPKLHKFPRDMLLAVCATREGSLLRFWRLLERQWTLDANALRKSRQMFREILTAASMSRREVDVIMKEIAEGYPLLDFYYGKYAPQHGA